MPKAQGSALVPQGPQFSPCAVGGLLASNVCVHLSGFASESKVIFTYFLWPLAIFGEKLKMSLTSEVAEAFQVVGGN